MESQMLFNIVIGLAAFFGGWTLNSISRTLERLDSDVRDMPHMYVNREDYREDINDIKGMLGKIFDRLEHKADK